MKGADLRPAEILFPHGPVDWTSHQVSLSFEVESLDPANRYGCRVLFDGRLPSDVEPGLPCVVFTADPQTGEQRFFNSTVVSATAEAILIRPPKESRPEQRKRRVRLGLQGRCWPRTGPTR